MVAAEIKFEKQRGDVSLGEDLPTIVLIGQKKSEAETKAVPVEKSSVTGVKRCDSCRTVTTPAAARTQTASNSKGSVMMRVQIIWFLWGLLLLFPTSLQSEALDSSLGSSAASSDNSTASSGIMNSSWTGPSPDGERFLSPAPTPAPTPSKHPAASPAPSDSAPNTGMPGWGIALCVVGVVLTILCVGAVFLWRWHAARNGGAGILELGNSLRYTTLLNRPTYA